MPNNPYEIKRQEREHGPEWWAMNREIVCVTCGHSAYQHRDRQHDGALAPCTECPCDDFLLTPLDDNQ